MEKIWEDKYFKGILTLMGLLFFILILLSVPKPKLSSKVVAYLFIVLASFLILQLLRARLSYVSKEGVRIGNCYWNCAKHIILRQKPTFIIWSNVKDIKIVGVRERSLIHGFTSDYLVITTKKNKKCDCLLNDPKGFVEVLRQLGKFHLFAKDSKYIHFDPKK